MAKRKATARKLPVDPSEHVTTGGDRVEQKSGVESQLAIAVDAAFGNAIADVEHKIGKTDRLVGHKPVAIVLPVPSLATRYLMQNEGLIISRVYELLGAEASYKSTMLAEWMRWHWLCGGRSLLCEAETKPTPDLRLAALDGFEEACRVEDCASLEDWQRKLTFFTSSIQKQFMRSGGPGRTVPFLFGVDSLMGKAAEGTVKKVLERGCASKHFADEAFLISDYMRVYPQLLINWPMTLCCINHLKMGQTETGLPERRTPGGFTMKFQKAMEIEMGRVHYLQQKSTHSVARVYMKTYKNSYGADRRKIELDITFRRALDERTGKVRLHLQFEWWAASIELLMGTGFTATEWEYYGPKIADIIDLHKKSGGAVGTVYWSNALGVPSSDAMSAHDLGYRLEEPEAAPIRRALYDVLGVRRRPMFRPGVDFLQQIEEAQDDPDADAENISVSPLPDDASEVVDE